MAAEVPSQSLSLPESACADACTGTFERLPKWLNLVPMVCQWAWLGLRHGSLTLPSSANPAITTGGLVGDAKSEYFHCMGPHARSRVAPFVRVVARGRAGLAEALAALHAAGIAFPVVAKPDLGWCGFGVRRIEDAQGLADYLAAYPRGEALLLQAYLAAVGEAGIFYVRHPDRADGWLLGILLRHAPQVTGDGVRTLAELVAADARLRRVQAHPREHQCAFDPARVPAAGEVVRLSLIGSTRVGGRYEDGSALATPELLAAVEAIARDMPVFHAGRFDVRFDSLAALRAGRFTIMEVNGAGSEAVHAWDPKYRVREVYAMVFAKQRTLFAIGAANRRRGYRPVGAWTLLRHHLRQQRLIRRYPPSN